MTELVRRGAKVDIKISAQTDTLTFDFTSDPDLSGTWLFKVRDKVQSSTVAYAPTVTTTSAATGTLYVPVTETALLALIPTGAAEFRGEYSMTKDTVEYFYGSFVVTQKATRA